MNQLLIEIIAAVFGIVGTLLLATNGRFAGWGFIAFLVSNTGWLIFSYTHSHWAMFAQQVGFTISSLLGAWIWIVKPALDKRFSQVMNDLFAK
jgi:nicotinamide riboside transporter PnuC